MNRKDVVTAGIDIRGRGVSISGGGDYKLGPAPTHSQPIIGVILRAPYYTYYPAANEWKQYPNST